jgi:hypothetical protein
LQCNIISKAVGSASASRQYSKRPPSVSGMLLF